MKHGNYTDLFNSSTMCCILQTLSDVVTPAKPDRGGFSILDSSPYCLFLCENLDPSTLLQCPNKATHTSEVN